VTNIDFLVANHGKNTTGEGMIPPAMGLPSRADVHLKPECVGGYHWGYLTALLPRFDQGSNFRLWHLH